MNLSSVRSGIPAEVPILVKQTRNCLPHIYSSSGRLLAATGISKELPSVEGAKTKFCFFAYAAA
jgi:hypothetical protein